MNNSPTSKSPDWLALMIGNSRLHWAYFQEDKLQTTWDTNHLSNPLITSRLPSDFLLTTIPNNLPLYIASVVPSQTKLWQNYPNTKIITLEQIPLKNIYPTMGIDRALAILGAGEIYGFPCLVIDAGTALTLTGVDSDRSLIGGAILPGLKLQFQSLATKAAALPNVNLPDSLPLRWSINTPDAITSGILYTILGGIKTFIDDWLKKYPSSQIILTGGDSQLLLSYFKQEYFKTSEKLKQNKNLIFWGILFSLLS
ncbi:pantothenate kinase [Aphanothece sacrum]|uniref:Type III pantothenate kinase n=1 Tax=Aphanothece sacrum FPU1 TaxID=1920663 RepID=A0A401IGC4_APHSA|nr:pantothenate kinase [Aphanothece sacrum]GBF80240.1 pantothenate kinase [Aphanothece sacrum FPU1]GBF83645.1 pantothenate kinase [Aphanothece sacrum FPU3]